MDPNKTLDNIRAIIRDLRASWRNEDIVDLADELAEMVTDLDQWLSKGRLLPTAWQHEYAHHT